MSVMGNPQLAPGDVFAGRFEVDSELHHPGIVSYISHGQLSEGQVFLAGYGEDTPPAQPDAAQAVWSE